MHATILMHLTAETALNHAQKRRELHNGRSPIPDGGLRSQWLCLRTVFVTTRIKGRRMRAWFWLIFRNTIGFSKIVAQIWHSQGDT